jgi:hypothetical protein
MIMSFDPDSHQLLHPRAQCLTDRDPCTVKQYIMIYILSIHTTTPTRLREQSIWHETYVILSLLNKNKQDSNTAIDRLCEIGMSEAEKNVENSAWA